MSKKDPNLPKKDSTKISRGLSKKKDDKKEKLSKKGSVDQTPADDHGAVSGPFQVTHQSGVSSDLEWSGASMSLFRLGQKLGEGSFGTVWKISPKAAKDSDSNAQAFAAKHIKIEDDTDTKEVENEINILKRCKSPYIVSYWGVFRQEGLLWIIMDFCELGSVLDMMDRTETNLPEKAAVWVLKSTLLGLQYLHGFGICHRDVKAGNILVTRTGNLKVADFGVSESLSETILGEIAGSPLWMAPEIIQRKSYNHKADIWSLGITAIELVQGDPPYAEHSAFRAMQMISKNDPPKLADPKSASKEFIDFLISALVKEQDQRPTTDALLEHALIKKAKATHFAKTVAKVLALPPKKVSVKDYKVTLIPISQLSAAVSDKDGDDEDGSAFGTTVVSGTTRFNSNSGTTVIDSAFSTVVSSGETVKNGSSQDSQHKELLSVLESFVNYYKSSPAPEALRPTIKRAEELLKPPSNEKLPWSGRNLALSQPANPSVPDQGPPTDLPPTISVFNRSQSKPPSDLPRTFAGGGPPTDLPPTISMFNRSQSKPQPSPTGSPSPSPAKPQPAVPPKTAPRSAQLEVSPEVTTWYNDIRSTSPNNWAIFGYQDDLQKDGGSPTLIVPVARGSGGIKEMVTKLQPGHRNYCYLRLEFDNLTKFVLITWVGNYTPIRKRGEVSTHKGLIKQVLANASLELHFSDIEDLNEKDIIAQASKLRD